MKRSVLKMKFRGKEGVVTLIIADCSEHGGSQNPDPMDDQSGANQIFIKTSQGH